MGHYSSRRMMLEDDSSVSLSSSDGESDADDQREYAVILQSLIDSFFYSEQYHTASAYTEEFYESDLPKIRFKPKTSVLNRSQFAVLTKQSSGMLPSVRKKIKMSDNLYSMVLGRELGAGPYTSFSYSNKCKIFNNYLPNKMTVLDYYPGKVFCGTFSKDGSSFITASQDRQIRLYKSDDSSYKLQKIVRARDVGWSIIDVAFSPDKKHFVYTTWSSSLHLCPMDSDSEEQAPLCLTHTGRRFCVFSVMFSADGKEILGGANDGFIYIYDLERNSRTLKIPAHEYDVNSIAFANESSDIIYSGGDDGVVKVWDRRTLDESTAKPVGLLAGHMDGITYIDSRGDARHLISNSKDQTIKLWDVRVFSGETAAQESLRAVKQQGWDYRWQEVPRKMYNSKHKLEGDTSVMTYRGHVVIKTLVRCRFSPIDTTGQRYIYTGCGLGRIVVYDALTGRIKQALKQHGACVRDVSWHPYRNEILSSSWDGTVGCWTYEGGEVPLTSEKPKNPASRRYKKTEPLRRSARLAKKKRPSLRSRERNSP